MWSAVTKLLGTTTMLLLVKDAKVGCHLLHNTIQLISTAVSEFFFSVLLTFSESLSIFEIYI